MHRHVCARLLRRRDTHQQDDDKGAKRHCHAPDPQEWRRQSQSAGCLSIPANLLLLSLGNFTQPGAEAGMQQRLRRGGGSVPACAFEI